MCKKVDEARKKVVEGIQNVRLWQERPITIVVLSSRVDGVTHQAIEWSKVMWDDRWNPDRGKKVAIGKATKRIAQAIVDGTVLFEDFYGGREWV